MRRSVVTVVFVLLVPRCECLYLAKKQGGGFRNNNKVKEKKLIARVGNFFYREDGEGEGSKKKSFIYSFFPVAHPVESFCGTSSNLSPPPPMMDGVAIPGYFFQPPPLCRGFFFVCTRVFVSVLPIRCSPNPEKSCRGYGGGLWWQTRQSVRVGKVRSRVT